MWLCLPSLTDLRWIGCQVTRSTYCNQNNCTWHQLTRRIWNSNGSAEVNTYTFRQHWMFNLRRLTVCQRAPSCRQYLYRRWQIKTTKPSPGTSSSRGIQLRNRRNDNGSGYVPRNPTVGELRNRPQSYSNSHPIFVRLGFRWTTAFDSKKILFMLQNCNTFWGRLQFGPIKFEVGTIRNRFVPTNKLTHALLSMLEVRRYRKAQYNTTDAGIRSVCCGPTKEAVCRLTSFPL